MGPVAFNLTRMLDERISVSCFFSSKDYLDSVGQLEASGSTESNGLLKASTGHWSVRWARNDKATHLRGGAREEAAARYGDDVAQGVAGGEGRRVSHQELGESAMVNKELVM